jgi:site-specific DNA recombinase
MPREDWIAVATVPAIVSQELFDRVQAKLRQNQQFATRHNTVHDYLLRALVSCGVCGLACMARRLPGGYGYYVCRGKTHAVQSCRDQKCPARFLPAQQLDELVWADLCALLTEPEQLAQGLARAHAGNWLPQELQARREGLRKGQASLEQQLERLTEAYLDGIVGLDEYRRRRSEGEQRRQALLRQQAQLEAQVNRQAEVANLALTLEDFCRRTTDGLAQATFEQKRQWWSCSSTVSWSPREKWRFVM